MPTPPFEVPVDPDAPDARDLVRDELAKPAYEAAQPTWFDRLVQQILDWFSTLRLPGGEGGFPWWAVVLVVVVALVVGAAILVYGLPRRNRRTRAARALFGDIEERDAATLRAAAHRAAADGDLATAIAELYRAVARELVERTLVSVYPGTTAHGFAATAGTVFPGARERLERSADAFDDVRYLGRPGTREAWLELLALDDELRSARPARAEVPA